MRFVWPLIVMQIFCVNCIISADYKEQIRSEDVEQQDLGVLMLIQYSKVPDEIEKSVILRKLSEPSPLGFSFSAEAVLNNLDTFQDENSKAVLRKVFAEGKQKRARTALIVLSAYGEIDQATLTLIKSRLALENGGSVPTLFVLAISPLYASRCLPELRLLMKRRSTPHDVFSAVLGIQIYVTGSIHEIRQAEDDTLIAKDLRVTIGEYLNNKEPSYRVAALQALGKLQKLFADDKEINASINKSLKGGETNLITAAVRVLHYDFVESTSIVEGVLRLIKDDKTKKCLSSIHNFDNLDCLRKLLTAVETVDDGVLSDDEKKRKHTFIYRLKVKIKEISVLN